MESQTIENNGKNYNLRELIDSYERMRWRKWPEEIPVDYTPILIWVCGNFKIGELDGENCIRSNDGQYYMRSTDLLWLPISVMTTLPMPVPDRGIKS